MNDLVALLRPQAVQKVLAAGVALLRLHRKSYEVRTSTAMPKSTRMARTGQLARSPDVAILLRPDGLYGTRPAEGGNKAAKLRAIRKALRTAKRVWLATDCDREGQLIGQETLQASALS